MESEQSAGSTLDAAKARSSASSAASNTGGSADAARARETRASAKAHADESASAEAAAADSEDEPGVHVEKFKRPPTLFKCGCDFGGVDMAMAQDQGLECDCSGALRCGAWPSLDLTLWFLVSAMRSGALLVREKMHVLLCAA